MTSPTRSPRLHTWCFGGFVSLFVSELARSFLFEVGSRRYAHARGKQPLQLAHGPGTQVVRLSCALCICLGIGLNAATLQNISAASAFVQPIPLCMRWPGARARMPAMLCYFSLSHLSVCFLFHVYIQLATFPKMSSLISHKIILDYVV